MYGGQPGYQLALMLLRTLTGLQGNSLNSTVEEMSPWAALILVSLVPAVGEELVFRGYLYRKLIRFGQLPYVLLSAFFFGSFHGNLEQFFYAFVLGCWLGYLVCRTGSVFYGMLIHLFINFFSSCVLTGVGEGAVINTLLGAGILALAGWGFVQFWDFRRRMFVRPATGLPQHPVRAALLNPGMLLWIVAFVAMCVINLFGGT
ncbi:CPBP family intramembrane glutamic endopeptidase [Allofournierella massiliensis]|uniref:CPBP family intramembrane glutamic endopeptidase n=1 Tax=Allofournierella massiliensis TaxID=1650663 RepID=UPI0035629767